MLALAGARRNAGLLPGRHGLAPSPELLARLLETAARVWSRGGVTRTQVAGKVQSRRASQLGRPDLRQGFGSGAGTGPPDLPRDVGLGSVSKSLSDPTELDTFGATDARMVFDPLQPGCARPAQQAIRPP